MFLRTLSFLLSLLVTLPATYAQVPTTWTTNHTPFRMLGNLYYVGSKDLAAYLITTPQGHILINENLASSVPQICQNIEALGFKLTDIKFLLNSQAHYDHAGGAAEFKRITHAQVAVMDADASVMESGGHDDFFFFDHPSAWFEPVRVDRVLHDGSRVAVGKIILTAHRTAGHTKGTTTWTMDLADAGQVYHVVIVGGAGINEGNNLVDDPRYLTQVKDFADTFRVLRALLCDIFLGAHGGYFNLQDKYARLQTSKVNSFVDPAGYQVFIAEHEQALRDELTKQVAQRQSTGSK